MKDFNNCLIVYIEIDVTDNIDSKAIISYNDFKIWKLVNEILILYLFAFFFFGNFNWFNFFNDYPKKNS